MMPNPEEAKLVAAHILQRLGEGGQPPEFGLHRINVGNESYLRVLEEEYFKSLLKMGSSFKLVQGYFGGGKTHFLHCVRELAWKHGFVSALVALSPTESPYDDALKVYQNVARNLSLRPHSILSPPNLGLSAVLRQGLELRQKRDDEAEKAKLSQWLQRELSRAWCESPSYRQAVVHFLQASLIGDFDKEQRLEAWLLGEAINIADLREYGIYENIGKSNAFTILRSLLQMLVALGFPGTALLFDEVDRSMSVSAKRSHVIGDNLRQVIDLCGRHQLPHTLFMYAVPPEFMRTIVPDYPALYQRLKSPVPLSVRSPQSVLIDLEKLDLAPSEMLSELGNKLVEVFEEARNVSLDRSIQKQNASKLAKACAEAYFDVNHRRLFVKTWIDCLYAQLADGESVLDEAALSALLWAGQQSLTEESDEEESFDDF